MISFRNFTEKDQEKIKDILIKEKVNDLSFNGIIYVVIDNENLVGAGKAKEENNKWFLEYLVIEKGMRGKGLGDGLLRVILNKLSNIGIKKVYCKQNNVFLINKGFRINNDKILELSIEELFNHNCNSCGGCNEL